MTSFSFSSIQARAFGQRQQLEALIGARYGEAQGLYANTDFSPLVDSANGAGRSGPCSTPGYTRLAMQQLVPETSQFQPPRS